MTWFAIRTAPGAQMPQREYAVEDSPKSQKGYRIVPSLNPHQSAVERALDDAGVSHYMPVEYRAVRLRRKTTTYTVRRFPMLPGYVFVHDVVDWMTLHEIPGVLGVVGIGGNPIPILGNNAEVIRLMAKEGVTRLEADDQIAHWQGADIKEKRKADVKAISVAKRRVSAGSRVRVLWGRHIGREATVEAWEADGMIRALIADLDSMETIRLPHDTVERISRAA